MKRTERIDAAEFLRKCRRKFKVIYADPPWAYSNMGTRSAAADNYSTMGISALMALEIEKVAAPDCALFLWTTAPFIPAAITVADSWGFTYKTIAFLWAKRNRKTNTPFFGMGNYTRANVEPCLLFTRGKPKRVDAGVPQFFWGPVLRHSEKPDAIRNRIYCLMGNVPRLELFARKQTRGWTYCGNQLLP